MVWNLLSLAISQGVGLSVFLVLAQRLEPAIFGLFALAVLFVDLIAVQGRSAVVDMLIMRQDFSRPALATAFTSFSLACVASLLVFWIASGWLAGLFDAPGLELALRALSISLLIAPFLAIYETLTLKELRFRMLSMRSIGSSLISAVAALWILFVGPADWALVGQRLTAIAAAAILLAVVTPWRPSLRLDRSLARDMAPAATKLWAAQLLNFGLDRIVDLVIGARLGAGNLGLYRVANRISETIHMAVSQPLFGAFVPVLSQNRGDLAAQRRHYLEITAVASLVGAPAYAGLACVGPDLVAGLLPDSYARSALLLSLIAAAGVVAPLAYFRGVALTALGRPGLAAWMAAADLAVTGAAVVIGAGFGLEIAVAALLVAAVAGLLMSLAVLSHAFQVSVARPILISAPAYLSAGVMAGLVLGLRYILEEHDPLLRAGELIAFGAAVFALQILIFHRRWLTHRLDYLAGRAHDHTP